MLNVKNIRLECETCELGHPLQFPCVAQLAASLQTHRPAESRGLAQRWYISHEGGQGHRSELWTAVLPKVFLQIPRALG